MPVLRARIARQILDKDLTPTNLIMEHSQTTPASSAPFVPVTPQASRKHRMSSTPSSSPEQHQGQRAVPTESPKENKPESKRPRIAPFPMRVSFAQAVQGTIPSLGTSSLMPPAPQGVAQMDTILDHESSTDEEKLDPGGFTYIHTTSILNLSLQTHSVPFVIPSSLPHCALHLMQSCKHT